MHIAGVHRARQRGTIRRVSHSLQTFEYLLREIIKQYERVCAAFVCVHFFRERYAALWNGFYGSVDADMS